jgi:hypothetical protein
MNTLKKYVMFYQRLLDGTISECIASDSYQMLDGRWSLDRCIDEAFTIAESHNKFKKGSVVAFQIRYTRSERKFDYYEAKTKVIELNNN